MGKWIGVLFIIVIQMVFYSGCASEEVKEPVPVVKEVSCTFNQLIGECRYFDNGSILCSTGTCLEGDCQNGKGVLTYPGGSRLEGTFKDYKLNGEGSYVGCSESFVGIFKNDFREKGFLVPKGSDKIYEGTFKDDLKTGNFNVYLDYNKQTPFVENGKVVAGVYTKKIVIPFIMDMDKNLYDSQEKERKEREIEGKKWQAERYKEEAREKVQQAKALAEQEKIRKAQEAREKAEKARIEAEERKWQTDLKQIQISVNAKRAPVLKAKIACEESRYEFSNECKSYDASKTTYDKYTRSICNYDEDEIRRKDKNADEKIRKREAECGFAREGFE